jgi:hypothetical protein
VDDTHNPIHWLVCAGFAFFGGLVHNVLVPQQRGVAGFVAAALVGTFCGVIGGVAAYEFDASPGVQWICSGGTGVFGYIILQGVFTWIRRAGADRPDHHEFHIYGGQNQVGNQHLSPEKKTP